MWVCRNCNEVNTSDDRVLCAICDADRNVVVEVKRPESGWACSSCGKRNPIRLRTCPVCNAPRYTGEVDRSSLDARPPARRSESVVRHIAGLIEGIGFPKIAGVFLVACLLLAAGLFALTRGPSEEAIRRHFEATELARINSEFAGRTLDGPDKAQEGALKEQEALSGMLRRLEQDCGNRMPSAVFLDQARGDVNPELFRKELVKLALAVERYANGRVGPIGAGYSLQGIRVLRTAKSRSGAARLHTVEYEATLAAQDDVVSYRPPYLAGQEHLPLVRNGDIDWGNYDRFYKAWLERNSAGTLAAAAEYDRNRGTREYARGGIRIVKGSMTFVKTNDGWEPAAAAAP